MLLKSAIPDPDGGRPNLSSALTASPGTATVVDVVVAAGPGAGHFPSGEGGTTGEHGASLSPFPPLPHEEVGRVTGDFATATSRYDMKR